MVDTNELLCPLCQGNNHCGVDASQSCWCMQRTIPKNLLEQVPDLLKNKACICQRCLEQYQQQLKQNK